MNKCAQCLLSSPHPFGISFTEDFCSGCLSFRERQYHLPKWDDYDTDQLISELSKTMGKLPKEVIVPFDADGETWFVLDVLVNMGVRPIVVYFNSQYHDDFNFAILSACQEHFDADFIGFSLPKDTIQAAISEEFSVGHGHCRNLEIFGRHAAALYSAEYLGVENIVAGPNQQSEVVGSHSFIIRNQLKQPAFDDIVLGKNILPQVQIAIRNVGSAFAQTFDTSVIAQLLERIQWHYLSDYIFWDSESINNYYGDSFQVKPRQVNGFGDCWQASSSSLKLEFFDLLRLIRTGTSKIDSYLSRDIRFGRLSKANAIERREAYLKKMWDIESIADFLSVSRSNIEKAIELYLKGGSVKYYPESLMGSKSVNVVSHGQALC